MLCLTAAISFISCHDDIGINEDSAGKGRITPRVDLNTAVESSKKETSRADISDITVHDLSLTIKSEDGSYSNTWASVDDYDPETSFKVGKYTIEASYGNSKKEGFECPVFFGTQDIEVLENQQTPVHLTASLANSMLSITYTDEFKRYMKEYDANIHSSGGQYVYYAQNETRPAYINPGQTNVNVSFVTPAGQSASLQIAKFNAEARHHYHLTIDLNNGTGSGTAVLVIVFDETLDQENLEIELNDELFNAPAPAVKGAGDLGNGKVYTHIFGDEWNEPLKANIIARGIISELIVTTHSQSLKEQGWPDEFDLMNADEVMKARLAQLGFTYTGLGSSTPTMAVLDFTDVVNHINEADDNANNFTIAVTDRMTKVSEPFSFAVNTIPMTLSIDTPSSLAVGATEFSFNLNFNGANPEKSVKFEYSNERGTWTPLQTISIAATGTEGVYHVTTSAPADAKPLTVRAVTKVKNSDGLTVVRVAPQYTATVDDKTVWAHKATVTLASTEAEASDLARLATVFVSTNGTDFTKAETTVSGADILLTGLNAATQYTVRVSVTDDVSQTCTPVMFTTESPLGVPNGDFETLSQTLHESQLNQNGQWGITAGIYYQSYLTYTISEPTGWASVNQKTTSSSTRNSWFVVPSTFNSTLDWKSTVPKIKVVGTGGGTETPASYAGFTAQSGSNAMVLRNVGWDPAGTVPSREYHTTSGSSGENHFNQKTANVSRISAGKLFLGSYSYNGSSETYNEGTAFASRPASLCGYYRYICDPQDTSEKGSVEVKVMNGSTVIGSGRATLAAADGFTRFEVKINYIDNAPKATDLRIMLCSSDKTNEGDIFVSTFNSRYESAKHGATLVVDNLTFTY